MTLIDRLRRITLDKGGYWNDHLQQAVDGLNEAVHSVTGFAPEDLWQGSMGDRRKAHMRTIAWRNKRNARRRYFPKQLKKGQKVWVFDAVAASAKERRFNPRWRGPYVLGKRISESLWKAREIGRGIRRGRKPVGIFHKDHIQPCLE